MSLNPVSANSGSNSILEVHFNKQFSVSFSVQMCKNKPPKVLSETHPRLSF